MTIDMLVKIQTCHDHGHVTSCQITLKPYLYCNFYYLMILFELRKNFILFYRVLMGISPNKSQNSYFSTQICFYQSIATNKIILNQNVRPDLGYLLFYCGQMIFDEISLSQFYLPCKLQRSLNLPEQSKNKIFFLKISLLIIYLSLSSFRYKRFILQIIQKKTTKIG